MSQYRQIPLKEDHKLLAVMNAGSEYKVLDECCIVSSTPTLENDGFFVVVDRQKLRRPDGIAPPGSAGHLPYDLDPYYREHWKEVVKGEVVHKSLDSMLRQDKYKMFTVELDGVTVRQYYGTHAGITNACGFAKHNELI